jgi:enamine deaminase RidA (YjgF/YER057c/UK114 family)
MHIARSNVPELVEPPGYTHLATAGQVPLDEHGELVGQGDPVSQAHQCLHNLAACLRAAGVQPDDVVRTTVYVVARESRELGRVCRALMDSELSAVFRTPATLLGVALLGYENQLVEIECTAVHEPA